MKSSVSVLQLNEKREGRLGHTHTGDINTWEGEAE